MCSFEIINAKEETDPAGKLLADNGRLALAVSACEQNPGATSGGTHNHPAFWPTIIRLGGNIFHELELEDVHKKINCWFVISHNEGDQFEL